MTETEEEIIKWYDREDHINFDVCADDHCQRYQGITRASTKTVREAIEATKGLVLMCDDEICDARFSKSCGGVSETFENCWEDSPHKYLVKVIDNADCHDKLAEDLSIEANAEQWIRSVPKSFCNTTEKEILSQVLNSYDQETPDFYRWKVEYSQKEISDLIRRKSGIDFGDILDIVPMERGVSGRLVKMKIVGSKRTLTIGKELEIRKILSESHLYSSAFVIDKEGDGIPSKFTLTGAGWGHGVGLCQIGAAVMAAKGYSYKDILFHYYKNCTIDENYGNKI
jgi:SpoIID/LytB domain protein